MKHLVLGLSLFTSLASLACQRRQCDWVRVCTTDKHPICTTEARCTPGTCGEKSLQDVLPDLSPPRPATAVVTGEDAEQILALLGPGSLGVTYAVSLKGFISERSGPTYLYAARVEDGQGLVNESRDQHLIEAVFRIASENGIDVRYVSQGSSYISLALSARCEDVGTKQCSLSNRGPAAR